MFDFGRKIIRQFSIAALGTIVLGAVFDMSFAASIIDPKPLIYQVSDETNNNQQANTAAVDGVNFTYGVLGGSLDGVTNGMGLISVSTVMPYFSSFGIQGDLAYGLYDGNQATSSAAAALHIFWRNPGVGMLGIYGDWGYLSPVHSGRLGMETAYYSGQWTVEGLFAMEFGQNVYTKFVDEIDLSYYFDDNTKVSMGHRFIARGNVFNVGFEKQFGEYAGSPWSVFGEAEAGEDDYYQVFAGIKASLGTGAATSMIGRDRGQNVRIRIPRNLASVTQCANVDNPFPAPKWLTNIHLITPGSMTETLCASKKSLNRVSSTGIFKP
jgi:hypothetical protein